MELEAWLAIRLEPLAARATSWIYIVSIATEMLQLRVTNGNKGSSVT